MSDDNPRSAHDKGNSCQKNNDSSNSTEPLIVTIEPQSKNKHPYEAKNYRLNRTRFRLEKKAYYTAHWTMIFLIIYTSLTFVVAVASIISDYVANKSANAAHMAAVTAQRQVADYEMREAPELVMEDKEVTKVTENANNDTIVIEGKFKIRNKGSTAAVHISSAESDAACNPQYSPIPHVPEAIHSIIPNDFEEHTFGVVVGKDMPTARKMGFCSSYLLQYSYFDIFGNPYSRIFCVRYGPELPVTELPCNPQTKPK